MGNSHHSKNDNHHRKPVEYIDSFLKWLKHQDLSKNKEFVKNYFENCQIIKILFENNYDIGLENLNNFLYAISEAFTGSTVSQIFIDIIYQKHDTIDSIKLNEIFVECCMFMLDNISIDKSYILGDSSKKLIESIVSSIRTTSDGLTVQKAQLQYWIQTEFPELFFGYSHWILTRVREINSHLSSKPRDLTLTQHTYDLSEYMNAVTSWYLCSNLPNVFLKGLAIENVSLHEKLKNCLIQKRWMKLYASDKDGLSLNRFQNHVFNYKGPTVVFFHCDSDACFCICSDLEYREAPTSYGSTQIRIFRLWPRFKAYDITSPNKCIYLNTRSKGLRLGFIFGDGELSPVLEIDENFQYANHEFKHADLLVACEAWACGDAQSLEKQLDMKKWESKQIDKMRTVKLDCEWNENADKAILDLAGITTEHSQRGDF